MSSTVPPTMIAVVVRELGGPEKLRVEIDYPTPKLEPGHVLVMNEFAGINFIDTYFRKGLYKADLPFVAGKEGGGTIVAVSDDVSATTDSTKDKVRVGDKVVYSGSGTYCEYTAVAIDQIVSVPANVGLDVAVACMVQGLTAHYLTTSAHVNLIQKGEWCLIYSVGSGTCQWAAQMAKIQGYKVVGTTSRGKEGVAKQAGCDALIVLDEVEGKSYSDYESQDIVSKVMELTNGKGVKCVLDGVGKSTVDISIRCLDRRGIFVSFGNASGAVPDFSLLRLVGKSLYVTRPTLKDYVSTREELQRRASDVFSWYEGGEIQVRIDQVFSLDDAVDGHLYLEAGKSKGKLLYRV